MTIFLHQVSGNSVQSAPTVITPCWDIRYCNGVRWLSYHRHHYL